jgi:hypothetical protein
LSARAWTQQRRLERREKPCGTEAHHASDFLPALI